MKCSLLVAVAMVLVACSSDQSSSERHFRIMGVPDGPPGMEVAGRITARFISDRLFLAVVYPDVKEPTSKQLDRAISIAMVQPEFRESNPDGPSYIACTVHEPDPRTALAIADRCEKQLREVAKGLGVSLGPAELP